MLRKFHLRKLREIHLNYCHLNAFYTKMMDRTENCGQRKKLRKKKTTGEFLLLLSAYLEFVYITSVAILSLLKIFFFKFLLHSINFVSFVLNALLSRGHVSVFTCIFILNLCVCVCMCVGGGGGGIRFDKKTMRNRPQNHEMHLILDKMASWTHHPQVRTYLFVVIKDSQFKLMWFASISCALFSIHLLVTRRYWCDRRVCHIQHSVECQWPSGVLYFHQSMNYQRCVRLFILLFSLYLIVEMFRFFVFNIYI